MMLNIGTLANVIKHCDIILDNLSAGNEPQFCARLTSLAGPVQGSHSDVAGRLRLMAALDQLALNLRVLKMSNVTTADEE